MNHLQDNLILPTDYVIKHFQSICTKDAALKYLVGDYYGAKKNLEELINERTNNSEIFYLMGLVENRLNNPFRSIQHFTSFIEMNSKSYTKGYGYFQRGICFNQLNNFSNAKKDFIEAIQCLTRLDQLQPYIHFNLGVSELNLDNYELAIMEFNISINHFSYKPIPYLWRSYCNLLLNNKKCSCLDLQKAILLGADDLFELYFKFCK